MPTAGPRGGRAPPSLRRPTGHGGGPLGAGGRWGSPDPTSTLLDISVLTPNRPSGRAARSPERSHAAGRPRPQQETNPNRGGPMGPDGAPGSCDPGNECSKLGETRSAPPREPALAPPGGDAQEGRVRGPTRRPVQPPLSRGASAGAGAHLPQPPATAARRAHAFPCGAAAQSYFSTGANRKLGNESQGQAVPEMGSPRPASGTGCGRHRAGHGQEEPRRHSALWLLPSGR